MTIDERIERLTANQERFDGNLQKLAEQQENTQVRLANVMDTVMRLERIALSHEDRPQDVEAVLAKLEGRIRKPQ